MKTQLFFSAIIVGTALLLLLIVLLLYAAMKRRYEETLIRYQNKLLSQEMEEVRGIYLTMRGCGMTTIITCSP